MTDDPSALERLAASVGRRMQAIGGLIATAESCTGGLLAQALTETAGSSEWFDRGFVTYSNEAKIDLLGVRSTTLDAHGAVSEAVAREMAIGALRHSRAALVLSVTGIAGPGGASPGKPVGTVCFGFGLALPGGVGDALIEVETAHFDGDRRAVRLQAGAFALAQGIARVERALRDRPPAG
ncbi:MAG: CinA family protein [Lautropia sp.]